MNTLRKFSTAAAVGCLLWASPSLAGPNDPPPGAKAVGSPEAADGTLGMALMGASVAAAGTLTRGSGVTSVAKLAGLGNYEVLFDRDVTTCFYSGTIGPGGAGSALGEINVAGRSGKANGVFVDTNNSDGTAADKPFHLIVFCAR